MSDMFVACLGLKELDLSHFETSNVRSMSRMFFNCGLTTINLSSFNTANVTDMSYMFDSGNFSSIDLSSFDTSNVESMEGMFNFCTKITRLDLRNFNITKVKNISKMFYKCLKIKTILVNESLWDVSNVEAKDMTFGGCLCLVGGNGTEYSMFHQNGDYACIDKPGQKGYLTGVDNSTSISNVKKESSVEKSVYNIGGFRIIPRKSGVYISHGKKVIQ